MVQNSELWPACSPFKPGIAEWGSLLQALYLTDQIIHDATLPGIFWVSYYQCHAWWIRLDYALFLFRDADSDCDASDGADMQAVTQYDAVTCTGV